MPRTSRKMKKMISAVRKLAKQQNRRRTRSNPAPKRRSTRGKAFQALPAAYATHVKARFSIISRNANTLRVTGRDLVYKIPDSLVTTNNGVFVVVPCNPVYWKGTRISSFASAYMNYRPLKMTFSYVPQVAVTQQGTITYGTLWNGASLPDDFQQTLVTSNGGGMIQCYLPCDTQITLGANLQQNLFTVAGDMNPDTSPFIFVAAVAGADVVPGYWFVSYTYEFKNPIGSSWNYSSNFVSDLSTLDPASVNSNTTIVPIQAIKRVTGALVDWLGPGSLLDYETEPDTAGTGLLGKILYKGSEVLKSLLSGVPGWIFSNGQGWNPVKALPSNEEVEALEKQVQELQQQVAALQEAAQADAAYISTLESTVTAKDQTIADLN